MSDLVREVSQTVALGSSVRSASRVSIQREISTPLPGQVVGGGGISKTTATVELVEPATVATVKDSPWFRQDAWPPERGAAASVDVAVNDADPVRRFTGRLYEVRGSARTPAVSARLEDATHRFRNVQVTHEPLQRTMPKTDLGTSPRTIGLNADYLADYAMRNAGFHCTPQPRGLVACNAPMQGSLWPRAGALRGASGTINGFPAFDPGPWGWIARGFSATYRRTVSWNVENQGSLCVGLCVAQGHAGDATVVVHNSENVQTGMRVTSSRAIEVLGNNETVIDTVTPPNDGWRRVVMIRSAEQVVIATDTGWDATVTHSLGSGGMTGTYDHTQVTAAQSARIAGLCVWYTPDLGRRYVTDPLTARLAPGTLLGTMAALPAIENRDAAGLLREISDALAISTWIDRDGVLQWWHPDRLRNQTPMGELTATADIIDAAWQDSTDAARSSVTLSYRYGWTRIRNLPRITVWEGSGETLEQGESQEMIASPGADEDWIMVEDLGPSMLATPQPANPQAIPDFNKGIGSWVGGSPMNADGETPGTLARREAEGDIGPEWRNNQTFPVVQRTLEQIGVQAWSITVGWQDIPQDYWIGLDQRLDLPRELTQGEVVGPWSRLNGSWDGQKLPMLRARGRTLWEDREYTSTITGPSSYDALYHDIGPYIRPADGVARFADWLAEQVTQPRPFLDGLEVAYRPDLDVGQVWDVVEDAVYNLRLRIVITAIDESHERGRSTMTISGRVVSHGRARWTYDELDAHWSGQDYDDLAAAGGTYDELSYPPLEN